MDESGKQNGAGGFGRRAKKAGLGFGAGALCAPERWWGGIFLGGMMIALMATQMGFLSAMAAGELGMRMAPLGQWLVERWVWVFALSALISLALVLDSFLRFKKGGFWSREFSLNFGASKQEREMFLGRRAHDAPFD